jgi:hypothetical protein
MPVWARDFYINKIVEFKQLQNKEHEKHQKQIKRKQLR